MPTVTRYFTVTVPQGLSDIKLDSKGCATCQITVKNVSRATIDGRAILISLPITRPPAGVVEKNWVKIDGPTDRHFAIDQEEVFSIKIAVPQKKGEPAPAGNYSFRLDVVNVARPDESSDQSQALGFTVAAAAPPKPSRWPLIAAVAAVVLVVAGLATWLLTRGNAVPDLSGKTTDEAYTLLANAKFILDENIDHVDSGPENSGLIVAQKPQAGKRASAGSVVKIALGAPIPVCAAVNEHDVAKLSCPPGLKIVGLAFVSYGTPDGSCSRFSTSSCHAGGSAGAVVGLCKGRPECSVPAENSVFGDPCPNIPKRLYIQATCSRLMPS